MRKMPLTNTIQRVYFSLQFKGTVNHGREVKELWEAEYNTPQKRKKGTINMFVLSLLLLIYYRTTTQVYR